MRMRDKNACFSSEEPGLIERGFQERDLCAFVLVWYGTEGMCYECLVHSHVRHRSFCEQCQPGANT